MAARSPIRSPRVDPPAAPDARAAMLPAALRPLLEASAYPHPVSGIRVVETHISWVLLTGRWAYKIKKPVSLGFLDFSTLALRHAACLEELRLNARFAPQLYVDVAAARLHQGRASWRGSGPPIEYAVRMREFEQDAQLDRLLAAGRLGPADMDALAAAIAGFHAAAPRAEADGPFGTVESIVRPAHDNLDALAPVDAAAITRLRNWTLAREAQLAPHWETRRAGGFVREVHGDLHLANLVRLDRTIVAFDCIEFSPALRWIDLLNDLAFATMDLQLRGRTDLAYRLLNGYLEHTGDYAGVRLLRYYEVYRALVRAKVAEIRRATASGAAQEPARRERDACLALAAARSGAAPPVLVLMHGLAGSGKTWLSQQVITALPAVRVRSDVERRRLHALAPGQRSGSPVAGGIYDAAASARTYDALLAAACAILEGGESAIVDAAFLRRDQRQRFAALAQALGVPWRLLACEAPAELLAQRIEARRADGADASEADAAVLAHQQRSAEPLQADEQAAAIRVDTRAADAAARALDALTQART